MVYGTEFRVVFSSAEGFGTEFREYLFRGTVGIPSEITICSVNSVFRGNIILSKIPNPRCGGGERKVGEGGVLGVHSSEEGRSDVGELITQGRREKEENERGDTD